jgi:hypothetical protein
MDFMTRLRLHGKGKDGFDGCVVLGSSPRFSAAGRLGLQGGARSGREDCQHQTRPRLDRGGNEHGGNTNRRQRFPFSPSKSS